MQDAPVCFSRPRLSGGRPPRCRGLPSGRGLWIQLLWMWDWRASGSPHAGVWRMPGRQETEGGLNTPSKWMHWREGQARSGGSGSVSGKDWLNTAEEMIGTHSESAFPATIEYWGGVDSPLWERYAAFWTQRGTRPQPRWSRLSINPDRDMRTWLRDGGGMWDPERARRTEGTMAWCRYCESLGVWEGSCEGHENWSCNGKHMSSPCRGPVSGLRPQGFPETGRFSIQSEAQVQEAPNDGLEEPSFPISPSFVCTLESCSLFLFVGPTLAAAFRPGTCVLNGDALLLSTHAPAWILGKTTRILWYGPELLSSSFSV